MSKGEVKYSEKFPGHPRNYRWEARFDAHDGFIGISMFDQGKAIDRVLLSPEQVEALTKFIADNSRKRSR